MALNPTWVDTLSYAGTDLRRVDALSSMTNGTGVGALSGIRPGGGYTTTLAGSTISVSAGCAFVYFAGQGMYRAAMTSTWTGTLTAADATYTRIDLVYLRVWDSSVDASGLYKTDVVYLAGTPSASPSAPTPAGTVIYMPLATITVPQVSGGSASVSTTIRPVTVAPGGILPSATAPSTPYTGQFYDNGTDLLRYNGSGWDTYQKAPGAWTSYTPTWTATTTNPVIGTGTLIGRYCKIGRQVALHINLTPSVTTTFGAGNYNWLLPFAAANNGCSYILNAHLLGTDRWMGQVVISPNATTCSAFFNLSTTNSRIDFMNPTRPETFNNGSQLRITGTYESAT